MRNCAIIVFTCNAFSRKTDWIFSDPMFGFVLPFISLGKQSDERFRKRMNFFFWWNLFKWICCFRFCCLCNLFTFVLTVLLLLVYLFILLFYSDWCYIVVYSNGFVFVFVALVYCFNNTISIFVTIYFQFPYHQYFFKLLAHLSCRVN